ncbi:tetratricopeptide repeat protein, partial [Pseudophaeobacter sp.]|uniref:tetratricopeptide repeat protein n=1 Tax=Pseudophaeobacter sp. TaxID=1971739 RepID=UPI0032989460
GRDGVAANPQQAWMLLSRAAAEGAPGASYALGQMLEQGLHQQADFTAAVKMYRQAVEQGSAPAQQRLGTLAMTGDLDGMMAPHRMVPWVALLASEDLPEARNWLQLQAEAGLRPAQASYGQALLASGDAEAAAPWLTRAAEAGDVEAQHQLGRLYIQGEGLAQDYVQAHSWLNVAAAGGSTAAFEMRAVVADLMTPEQVAEAQALARQFFATARPGGAGE